MTKRRSSAPLSDTDRSLFRDAVRDATPIKAASRVRMQATPPSVPVQSWLDAYAALAESVTGPISWEESMETGEELSFLREGLGRDVLKKLRRGHWVVQHELDLHGLNRDQARHLLADFQARCMKRGLRCVRIVHGKGLGSPGREPVLKGLVRSWLSRREEVLAFCQAPGNQGGSGAVLVLLKA